MSKEAPIALPSHETCFINAFFKTKIIKLIDRFKLLNKKIMEDSHPQEHKLFKILREIKVKKRLRFKFMQIIKDMFISMR